MPPLLDFDELLLRVRSSAARAHIRDAVTAFRAGALRPAVVSAWAAVVTDIMAKVREIELTGDARAAQQAAIFDAIRVDNNVERSLAMERTILVVARDDFELLSHHEHSDLERLREDRHRCAHPAMASVDEAYEPSAELVRYHISSALSHLLTQPPVQGKAALQRVMGEVSSSLFPTDVAGALRVLGGGPLQRPKDVLVRDFVIATIKATLRGDYAADAAFVSRALAAVAAVSEMHPAAVDRVMSSDVPRILGGLDDDDLPRVLRLAVALPATWDCMPESVRTKLEQLVGVVNPRERPDVFLAAVATNALDTRVRDRVLDLDWQDIVALFQQDANAASSSAMLVDRAVQLLVASSSWNASNALITAALIPAARAVTEAHLEAITSAATTNVEVEHAHTTPALLVAIRDAGSIPVPRFLDIVLRSDLAARFTVVLDGVAEAALNDAVGDARVVGPGDRVRHPVYGEGTVVDGASSTVDDVVRVDFHEDWVQYRTLVRALSRLDRI